MPQILFNRFILYKMREVITWYNGIQVIFQFSSWEYVAKEEPPKVVIEAIEVVTAAYLFQVARLM
jgi:hypothetical protein